ncbi:hypothetical protein J421_2574 [Gemmatirosa kalamazoonensis]|uniref:Uncharacterized protein n=1 Tax=Gemmatirosa kalamazoonensis TaxID=861299 RepID=W0RH45_9BACT|nr:hypothetical protein [Gemmatirosa kalamazoonensis]AHG90111.1 hypothetical protein J421_2574 [Gemmatirosa kalamazoonensis]
MRRIIGAAVALAAMARGAAAQNEAALRQAFEGRTVAVKIDMPATSQGVNVYPQDGMPLDYRELAQRLKDNGTALKMGTSIMVTKVVVKKDHIEFQLGGGGYGTFGDWMTSPSSVNSISEGESQREKDLKSAIKNSSGDEKKRLERELSSERSSRERENSKAQAEAAQANMAREANIRTKRLDAGSRFNIYYRQGIPPEALTADGVVKALEKFVTFPDAPAAVATSPAPAAPRASFVSNPAPASAAPAAAPPVDAAPSAGGVAALKKGMSLKDVETLLGPASTASETKNGTMTVAKRTYRKDGLEVAASFVGGVLIDFAIKPI